MPSNSRDNACLNHPKTNPSQSWGTSKLDVAQRILGVEPKGGEKGVALRVGEKLASQSPVYALLDICISMYVFLLYE